MKILKSEESLGLYRGSPASILKMEVEHKTEMRSLRTVTESHDLSVQLARVARHVTGLTEKIEAESAADPLKREHKETMAAETTARVSRPASELLDIPSCAWMRARPSQSEIHRNHVARALLTLQHTSIEMMNELMDQTVKNETNVRTARHSEALSQGLTTGVS